MKVILSALENSEYTGTFTHAIFTSWLMHSSFLFCKISIIEHTSSNLNEKAKMSHETFEQWFTPGKILLLYMCPKYLGHLLPASAREYHSVCSSRTGNKWLPDSWWNYKAIMDWIMNGKVALARSLYHLYIKFI